jgi:hypothetical protein
VPDTKEPERESVVVDGREVSISNPNKILFPQAGYTKRDLVRYYLAVADGALRGAGGRPNVLVRYPNGVAGEFFFQKRAPSSRPDWIDIVALQFPSGRTAEEVVPRDAAALAWMANLAWPMTTRWIQAALALWGLGIVMLSVFLAVLRRQLRLFEAEGSTAGLYQRVSLLGRGLGAGLGLVVIVILYLMVFKPGS